ncbi:MAG: hypothetical protein QOJ37_1051, partial [Pseudonocardiales bacterium]|nr:hypothetical protein [Pseudonocardiales bacterium]
MSYDVVVLGEVLIELSSTSPWRRGSALLGLDGPRQVVTACRQLGAGDVFVGTVAARLALGDDLLAAARLGTAAASLSLAG